MIAVTCAKHPPACPSFGLRVQPQPVRVGQIKNTRTGAYLQHVPPLHRLKPIARYVRMGGIESSR